MILAMLHLLHGGVQMVCIKLLLLLLLSSQLIQFKQCQHLITKDLN
jgi:hypothetical protein